MSQAPKSKPVKVLDNDALLDSDSDPTGGGVSLANLDILPATRSLSWGRSLRVPGRLETWLLAPRRRRIVGYSVAIVCHLAAIVGLVFWVVSSPAEPTMPARAVVDLRPPQPTTEGFEVLQSRVTQLMAEGGPSEKQPRAPAKPVALDRSAGPPQLAQPPWVARPEDLDTRRPSAGPARPAGPALAAAPVAGPSVPAADLLLAPDTPMQGKLMRRSADGRSEGVRYGSGTSESEEAVERGLRWLLTHQRTDGSWSCNHTTEACQHYCTHPGTEASTTAATGLALLPFLGAGYTHREGEFQDIVRRGLDHLRRRAMKISYGTDLRDGSMYGHAIATIALCEAYALTGDPELKEAAQGAIQYIAYAQDLKGGGWRYNPGEPGDTTVSGWMLMALKSGQMAKLDVPSPSIFLAEKFLTSVQNEDGSMYGYMTRKPRQTTTAVGLLCRMYTGWRRDNPALVRGVAHLNEWGPAKDDIYYDYYATQVMFHWSGPEWDAWNRKTRDLLISVQQREGHQAGSWYFGGKHDEVGGRLYCTAMATMILEVYYRFMPLYTESAVDGKF